MFRNLNNRTTCSEYMLRCGNEQTWNKLPALQQHCSSIAAALQQHCSSIAAAMQQHCSSIAAALQQHCSSIAAALQQHCSSIAAALQQHCSSIAAIATGQQSLPPPQSAQSQPPWLSLDNTLYTHAALSHQLATLNH